MLLARVEGHVVATRKHASLGGWKLLLCQPITAEGRAEGSPFAALDPWGAGLHDRVIVSTDGAWARRTVGDPKSPARLMIIGIVDPEEVGR
jgi:ethanolamine utilization protein EutN